MRENPSAPEPPVILEVRSVGFSWIEISWKKGSGNKDLIKYEVSISGGGGVRVIVVPGDKLLLNATDLEPGTEYTFSIVSEAADGQKSHMSSYHTDG